MERLTKRDIDGCLIHPWSFNGINGSYDIWDEELMEKQIDRLAAYEDTGLEPEEIKVHEAAKYNAGYYHGDEDRCRWIEKELGPIDHLRDLLHAEQDGLLVVLPCKAGSLIYVGRKPAIITRFFGYVRERYFHAVFCDENKGIDIPFEELGKTVFLTREEAEAAIAQEGDSE